VAIPAEKNSRTLFLPEKQTGKSGYELVFFMVVGTTVSNRFLNVKECTVNPDINVLIVDDEPGILKAVEHKLGMIGFKNVIATPNGKAALESLANNKIGLILSDWNMPEMNGGRVI
jgi:PleD family two-component response regulator